MEPRIVEKDAIQVVGLSGRFAPFDPRIPALWSRFVPRIAAGEKVYYDHYTALGHRLFADAFVAYWLTRDEQ